MNKKLITSFFATFLTTSLIATAIGQSSSDQNQESHKPLQASVPLRPKINAPPSRSVSISPKITPLTKSSFINKAPSPQRVGTYQKPNSLQGGSPLLGATPPQSKQLLVTGPLQEGSSVLRAGPNQGAGPLLSPTPLQSTTSQEKSAPVQGARPLQGSASQGAGPNQGAAPLQ